MGWIIEDWLPEGNKCQDTAVESGGKTIIGIQMAVAIAAGKPFLGQPVKQGPVLIVDEETPLSSLEKHLDRFSQGLGVKSYRHLPIKVSSMTGFRFDRKTELAKLLGISSSFQPRLIRLDSLIAMFPGGRQGISENDSHIGVVIRDDLNQLLNSAPGCSLLLAVHSKKPVGGFSVEALRKSDMQTLVRGHGSIVGEGCDTGFVFKKLSEYPEPTRFAIVTQVRRYTIPMSYKVMYVELKEERYGDGWARLEEISHLAVPPTQLAKQLFEFFPSNQFHSAKEVRQTFTLYPRKEILAALEELQEHRVIQATNIPQTWELNPKYRIQCNPEYLGKLQ
jgi:hypothetical protein